MTRLRSLLTARRWLALALIVAALAVRIIVPAGMMPGFDGGATFTICTGHGAVVAGHGKADPAKADAPCAFTGLTAAAIDTPAPPVLPAMPLPVALVIVAVGIAVLLRPVRLRPPLRGPPEPRAA